MIIFRYVDEPVSWWYKIGNTINPDKFPIHAYMMYGTSSYANRDLVYKCYQELSGVGYYVRRTDKPYGRELPDVGIVTEIDSSFVYIESEELESHIVPKADFHNVYEPLIEAVHVTEQGEEVVVA